MKDLLTVLYFVICFLLYIIILFHVAIIMTTAITTSNLDWQILFFVFLSLFIIFGFWSLVKVQISFLLKFIIFVLLSVVVLNYVKLTSIIPTVNKVMNIEYCIDRGYFWNRENNTCESKAN